MKLARADHGMVRIFGRALPLPEAKTLRNDISEAIHEAEGGDPIEWREVVLERKLVDTMARVWESGTSWQVRVWRDGGEICQSRHDSKEEALAAADEMLARK